jgi:hypothetical protein
MGKLSISLTMASFCVLSHFAGWSAEAAIDEQPAVLALIGEAGGQQDDELLAHAYALKNRGTLRGVYGGRAIKWQDGDLVRIHPKTGKVVEVIGPDVWQKVSGAWWTAALDDADPLGGRTEWRSEYDLDLMARKGRTLDTDGLYDGMKIGQTWFYKLRSK